MCLPAVVIFGAGHGILPGLLAFPAGFAMLEITPFTLMVAVLVTMNLLYLFGRISKPLMLVSDVAIILGYILYAHWLNSDWRHDATLLSFSALPILIFMVVSWMVPEDNLFGKRK